MKKERLLGYYAWFVIAVGATRTDLTDIGANVFRVCYTDDFQGPVMATFAYKELGKRKAALITDGYTATHTALFSKSCGMPSGTFRTSLRTVAASFSRCSSLALSSWL